MDNDYFDELEILVDTFENEGIVLYPTDTIWGIGCDIYSSKAVEKIYKIKNRPRDMPLVLLVSSIAMLKRYVNIHPRVETLLVYHKKPLTLIYEETYEIPEYLLSENNTIAIRVAQDDFCQALITQLDRPITSTSANLSGRPYPKHWKQIDREIISQVDYITKYKRNDSVENQPSVLAEFNNKGELSFIRE